LTRTKHEEILSSLLIAIDGPSGSGKSTTARAVARELGLRYIDTGAMYRAVTHVALQRGVALDDGERLGELASSLEILLEPRDDDDVAVLADGVDVSSEIRSRVVTGAVSEVSAHEAVRRAMVRLQRDAAEAGGAVLEGRDIGSVVLPWAEVKVYLDADPRVRAERRGRQLEQRGESVSLDELEADIRRRDEFDSGRENSPLRRPVGAWPIDTSDRTIAQQTGEVVAIARATSQRLADLLTPKKGQAPKRKRSPLLRAGQALSCFVARIFGKRIVRPMDARYEEAYLIAPNHISNLDPPFVGCSVPREIYFVAKEALFRVRWFGALIRSVNAFPIRRNVFDREAMAAALAILERGHSLMIFPEGGRVFGGELGKPRSGIGYLAIHSGVAVLPAYIYGSDQLRRCLIRRRRLLLAYGRPIRIPPELLTGYQASQDKDIYRQYAEMVMAAIADLRDRAGR
jgi:cytidylate kinase